MIKIQHTDRYPLANNSSHIVIPIETVVNKLIIKSLPFKTIGKKHRIFYECLCTCGEISVVDSSRLRTGAVKSCGCQMLISNKRQTERICKKCHESESETKFARWGLLCLRCTRHKFPRKMRNYYEKSLKNFVRYRLSSIRAKKRKVMITVEDVCTLYEKQNGMCALSGLPLTLKTRLPDTLSIDRIDSNLGYILDNIQLVCVCLNLAKNSFDNNTILDFIAKLKNGTTLHSLQTSR